MSSLESFLCFALAFGSGFALRRYQRYRRKRELRQFIAQLDRLIPDSAALSTPPEP